MHAELRSALEGSSARTDFERMREAPLRWGEGKGTEAKGTEGKGTEGEGTEGEDRRYTAVFDRKGRQHATKGQLSVNQAGSVGSPDILTS